MEKIFEDKEFHGNVTFFGSSFINEQPDGSVAFFNSALASRFFSAVDNSFSIKEITVDASASPAGLNFASAMMIGWSGVDNWFTVKDVAISRDSLGKLQINSGVVDTLRDLSLRTLTAGNGVISTAFSATPDDAEGVGNLIPAGTNSVDVGAVTNDVNDFITLPTIVGEEVGHTIKIACNAGGAFELRTLNGTTQKINTVDSDGDTNEYACTDTELITVTKISDVDGWVATAQTALGAIATPVVPDSVA